MAIKDKNKEQLDKYCIQLIEYFQNCQFTDIIGVGRILEVEEQEDFDEYLVNIVVAFSNAPRRRRKDILKLLKKITLANKDMIAKSELESENKNDN